MSKPVEPVPVSRIALGAVLCLGGIVGALIVVSFADLLQARAAGKGVPDQYDIERLIDNVGPIVAPIALAITLYFVVRWVARYTGERGGITGGAIAILASLPAFLFLGEPGIIKLIAYMALITWGYVLGDFAGKLPPPLSRSFEWANMLPRIEIVLGNIARQKVDVIVNPANPTLLGGSGVDGVIHAAAGPDLLAECRTLNGAKVGEAKITKGYKLPAPWVIHIVAPTWHTGDENEEHMLAMSYRNALDLAFDKDAKTIAFSSSTGAMYSFPIDKAAPIVLRTIATALTEMEELSVIIVCVDHDSLTAYQKALSTARVPVVKPFQEPQKMAA